MCIWDFFAAGALHHKALKINNVYNSFVFFFINNTMDKYADIFSTIMEDPGFQSNAIEQPLIKVTGVGGGGVNAVNHIYEQRLSDVSYAVLNTDRASLQASPVPVKLCLGNGRGAGDKPTVAKKATQDSEQAIAELLNDGTRMVFITASMGGGTGTGAAPVVAKVASEAGLLTVGVVTIPFEFEGKTKIKKALKGAAEMSQYVDSMIVINNQKLIEFYPEHPMTSNFALADETLAKAVTSISDLINTTGFWNIDFNDVDTTLRQTGVAIISTGTGSGDRRVSMAIEAALESPLLRNRDVYGSTRLLIAVHTSSKDEYTLQASEIKEIENFKNNFRNELEQITGWYYDDSLNDEVRFTVLAAGFGMTFDEQFDTQKFEHFMVLSGDQIEDDNVINVLENTPTYTRVTKTINKRPTPPADTPDTPTETTTTTISTF